MPLDARARALLSNDSLPLIEVPTGAAHKKRNFRFPTCVRPKRAPTEHETRAAFGDRTMTWLREGDDFEVAFGELEYDDQPRRLALPLLITSVVALIAIVCIIAF